jgi:hypothetical protein|tara:strand:- start:2381 stop:3139 length:759 start_codon:yes stop_codon:yes gene_type:complete
MYAIFLTGTAGAGKSLLTSVLKTWYSDKGATTIAVNLDPGAFSLPYHPDVDVRNHIDLESIMGSHKLGPNGALIFAADMISTRLPEIQEQVNELNSEYVIFDTPGQIELFAYRQSGPYFVENFVCETRSSIFLFDSTLVSNASNYVSIALLASSLQLRLKIPQIAVLSKSDIVGDHLKKLLGWSEDSSKLEDALVEEKNGVEYVLSSEIHKNLIKSDFSYELIPISSVTQDGLIELSAMLSRILRGGEEANN